MAPWAVTVPRGAGEAAGQADPGLFLVPGATRAPAAGTLGPGRCGVQLRGAPQRLRKQSPQEPAPCTGAGGAVPPCWSSGQEMRPLEPQRSEPGPQSPPRPQCHCWPRHWGPLERKISVEKARGACFPRRKTKLKCLMVSVGRWVFRAGESGGWVGGVRAAAAHAEPSIAPGISRTFLAFY